MSQRHAIVTAMFGHEHAAIAGTALPGIASYAARIGAELVVPLERRHEGLGAPVWEKFQIRDIARRFDRVCWLDIDLIVHPAAPSIFDVWPSGTFWAFDEGKSFTDRKDILRQDAMFYKAPIGSIDAWPHEYFNSGVMLFDRDHLDIFNPPVGQVRRESVMPEQTYLNLRLVQTGAHCGDVGIKWNGLHSLRGPQDRKDLWIVHYAGWPKTPDWAHQVIQRMRIDLKNWGKV